jgi:transposase
MDTEDQSTRVSEPRGKQRRRTIQERREIVEETFRADASVSRVARRHDVNANQLFYWRKMYREGRLGSTPETRLLPVKVTGEPPAEVVKSEVETTSVGTMDVKMSKGTLRITGTVDVVVLRAVLESLAR